MILLPAIVSFSQRLRVYSTVCRGWDSSANVAVTGCILAVRRRGNSGGAVGAAEVDPSLWMRQFPTEHRNCDQHAAFSVAAWPRIADADGSLSGYFNPLLEAKARMWVEIQGEKLLKPVPTLGV